MRDITTFRLYPVEGCTLYVRVHIHRTIKLMRAHSAALHVRGISSDKVGRGCGGFCANWQLWYKIGARWQRDPCVAEVNMCLYYKGTNVAMHELFHATAAWGRRVGLKWRRLDDDDAVNSSEEDLAYIHGELCRQFVNRAYKAGIYT